MTQTKGKLDPGAFSDVDAAGETSHFVAYLDHAATALKDFRRAGDELLGLQPGDRVLDVGCGTGDTIAQLAGMVAPHGRAIGVDASEAMVAEARKRAARSGLPTEFRTSDAHRLDFPDSQFDACTAERLFIHLADPAQALAEMVRVVKPGGRIVVRESDLDMIAIDAADRPTSRAIGTLFADSVRNGWIGRQLFNLFRSANLADVAIHPQTLIIREFGVFNAILPLEDTARNAIAAGRITAEAGSGWIADLRNRDASGHFFACGLAFIASGRKPAV